ncbi:MAG: S-layer homology domain-containing protein [Clostridia bacterium]|nr:S-layer homology domain-containing protein [Clostridia bacterium]
MKKRILSLIICAALALSLLPVATLAAETAYSITCEGGVTALVNRQKVTEAPAGSMVVLSGFTPGATLTVTDANGQPVPLNENVFTMPQSDVTVRATESDDPAPPEPTDPEYYGGKEDPDSWQELLTRMRDGETVKLTEDVTRTTEDTISFNGTLDLNGYCLDGGDKFSTPIINGGKLTICDSSTAGTGKIICHSNCAIRIETGSSLTLLGGSITGIETGVCVSGGSFIMTGGNITGSWNGVLIEVSPNDGNSGSFTMSGGSITGSGTGVNVSGGSFTMTDGSITGNELGALVSAYGSFTMTGGSITGNKTGVNLNNGSFSVSGSPEVTGNVDEWNNTSNVYLDSDSPLTVVGHLEEGAAIGVSTWNYEPGVFARGTDSYTLTDEDISHFSIDDPSYIVVLNNNGEAELVKPVPLYQIKYLADVTVLLNGQKVTGTVAPEDGQINFKVPEGVSVAFLCPDTGRGCPILNSRWEFYGDSGYYNDASKISFPAGRAFIMPPADVTVVVGEYAEFVEANSWDKLYAWLEKGKNVRLTGNVDRTVDESLHECSGVLDLNGWQLDCGEGFHEPIINGDSLTIMDSSTDGKGRIIYHNYRPISVGTEDGFINVSSLTLLGGSIEPAEGVEGGTAVNIRKGGSFLMTGGSITGNEYGVYVEGNFIMTGGSITGNEYGVYVAGNFIMTGGSITGNEKGVIVNSGGSFSVSGSPEVTGNVDEWNNTSNVYLDSDSPITVAGSLEKGAAIGVNTWMNEPGVFARGTESNTLKEEDLKHFFSDAEGLTVALNDNGEGELISSAPGGWPPDSGEIYLITAIDADTGDLLQGAKITIIEKETGKVIDEWTSTDGPHESLSLKKETVYIMRVLETPEGYEKPDDVEFMINETEWNGITVLSGPGEITNDGLRLLFKQKPAQPAHRGGGGGGGSVTYAVATDRAQNGSVSASPTNAAYGRKVTLTVTPDEGYRLDSLTVTDKNGNEVSVTEKGSGVYSFTMPDSKVTVTPVFAMIASPDPDNGEDFGADADCPLNRFTDASPAAWYHDGVHWALEEGVMNGVGADRFAPDGTATRATVVTMLWRLEGEPAGADDPFDDVPDGAWYAPAVSWAAENGVVNGTSETTFDPETSVTREQLAAILYRYAQSKGQGFSEAWAFPLDFSDAADVSEYAYEPMCWMTMNGIITGMSGGTLAPNENATRAQIATMFMRFCNVSEE